MTACLFRTKRTMHFRDDMFTGTQRKQDVAYRVVSYRDETYGHHVRGRNVIASYKKLF
jgi:hypothetical protein